MTLYQLKRRQRLPIDLDVAWSFFSNPNNLEQITPSWLNFQVTSSLPKTMYAGMIATYNLRFYDMIPLTWVTEITHVIEPYYFVDEQRFGPYAFWHHQHHFEATDEGTEMTDILHYKLPFGVLGNIAHALMVQRQLEDIFDFRYQMLDDFFGGQP